MLRCVMSVLTGLLIVGSASSAATAAEEVDRPIPQNHERQKQRCRDMLTWNQKTLVGSHDHVGKKDPRWDAKARAALEAAARQFSHAVDPAVSTEEVYALAKDAVDAGCDDPLILYLLGRMSIGADDPGEAEYERRMTTAAIALKASAYPAFRRFAAWDDYALLKAVRAGQDGKAREEASRMLDETLDLVVESRAQDGRNLDLDRFCEMTARLVLGGYIALGQEYTAAFERVDAKLAKADDLKAVRLWLKGETLTSYAWEARGDGPAGTVTDEGWRKFNERLADARKALEEAWTLEPNNTLIATAMLTVELGAGGGDRDAMERWFERAMNADGDNRQACVAKMEWLEPKWHGSTDELLAFGRACGDTKNWGSGIPLLLADAHFRVYQRLSDFDRRVYFDSPKVWREIKDVYEEYLSQYPEDHSERSLYAVYCALCGRYAESKAQFDLVGDNLTGSHRFSIELMKKFRTLAAKEATAKPPVAKPQPAPKGFRPLALEWDDPSGETGVLNTITDCLATSAGVDVLLSSREVFLLKNGTRAVRVYHDEGRFVRFEPACDDGRFVWVPVRSEDGPPFLLVIDPKTEKTWRVASDDGLPFKSPDDLPEGKVPFLQVAAVEPGKVCVAGSEIGSWIARISFSPEAGPTIEVIHKADEAPNQNTKERDHWKLATIRFRPVAMVTLAESGSGREGKGKTSRSKPLILVVRSGMGGINEHPLVVDPVAGSVKVLQRPIRFATSGSMVPGSFSVHQGSFYWIEPYASRDRSLMRLSATDLDGTPLARRLGPVDKVVVHEDRIELVGDQWWQARLAGGEARPLSITVPWIPLREFAVKARAERLKVSDSSQSPLRLHGICYSRHLGVLVLCGTSTPVGVTYQVDPAEAAGQAEPASR